MSSKVRIYLDFDGVINIIACSRGEYYETARGARAAVLDGYEIRYHQSVVDRIQVLSHYPGVEIVWLSSWGRQCTTDIEPTLGMGPFRSLDSYVLDVSDGKWFKEQMILQDAPSHSGGCIIWVDDDLDLDTCSRVSKTLGVHILPVIPHQWIGLTDYHLDCIYDHVRRFTEGD